MDTAETQLAVEPGSFSQSSGMETKRRHSRVADMRVPIGSSGLNDSKTPEKDTSLIPGAAFIKHVQVQDVQILSNLLSSHANHKRLRPASKVPRQHLLQASSAVLHAEEALPGTTFQTSIQAECVQFRT